MKQFIYVLSADYDNGAASVELGVSRNDLETKNKLLNKELEVESSWISKFELTIENNKIVEIQPRGE